MISLLVSVSYAQHDATLWNIADLTAMLSTIGLIALVILLYKQVAHVSRNEHRLITFGVGTLLICFCGFSINNIHIAVRGQDTANATCKMAKNQDIIIPKEHRIMKYDNHTYTHLHQYHLALTRRKAKKDALNQYNSCSDEVGEQKAFDYQIRNDHAKPPRFHNYL